jgi:hypothetical protein
MKAILMIDMPHDCVYCPCWRGGNDEFPFDDCTALQRPLTVEERDNKPDWCPLKPLPNAIKERGKWISEEYQKGWNAYRENLE